MSVDTEILGDMWLTVKEYISEKDMQIAADHVINVMADHSISEHELKVFAGVDTYLKEALDEYIGNNDEDDEDDDDYDNDGY